MKKYFIIAILLSILACKNDEKNTTEAIKKGFDTTQLDRSADPCDNFYQFAVGGWIKNNPIPPTEARWSSFNILKEENNKKIKTILKELRSKQYTKGSTEQVVRDFYLSAMDSQKVDQLGITPLIPLLNKFSNANTYKDLSYLIGEAGLYTGACVSGFVEPDAKNSKIYGIYLFQGSLGLPDKTFYFPDNERGKNILFAYEQYITQIFRLWKKDEQTADGLKDLVLKIEKDLAQISLDRTQLRNSFTDSLKKQDFNTFVKPYQNFLWEEYFRGLQMKNPDTIISISNDYFKKLDKLLKKYTPQQWAVFLQFALLNHFAPYLSSDFEQANFAMYQKTLSGINQMKSREDRVINWLNNLLGQPVGRLYVERYFPESSKQYVLNMVELIREVFKERIMQLDWMSDATKAKAIEKLSKFRTKIGYPDRWRDYSKLEIYPDSLLKNIMNINIHEHHYYTGKIGKPVDVNEWNASPHVINAFYNTNYNDITFPAGILQPPFFDPDADDALNFGGIGTVIGHEFTHGFDDIGSQFDGDGNLNNWWTKEDREKFDAKKQLMIEQFNQYLVADSVYVNGALTVGENIADLGGVILAYEALKKKYEKEKIDPPVIDGFTWQQRFFLAWANNWKMNITKEEDIRLAKTDPHAPSRYRVIGPLCNLKEFADAFNCKEGKMVKKPQERIIIW